MLDLERAHPLRYGPQKSEVKSRLDARIHPELAEAWLQAEAAEGRLFTRGDRLRRSGADLPLSVEHAALRDRMMQTLRAAGFSGPSQKELLDAFVGERDAVEMLGLLTAEESVVRLPGEILILSEFLTDARARLERYFGERETMAVADLKGVLDVSRKQGVPLLEYFDRLGWTARRGDVRIAGSRLNEAGERPR
ncbi:MAG: SelB C-terminal domain-containing protein [Candidatus Eisenbacteria bacterium]